jgi:3-oxoacyl-[acyl-carrier-protein] synthase-3
MSSGVSMGIVGAGHYLPPDVMTAEEIAEASGLPLWVVTDKLGIHRKHYAVDDTHPNEMAVHAARACLEQTGVDPLDVDVLICTTEEWKEYCLWTAGIDLAYEIGAHNAWAFDIHMRCATTVSALKTARALMADDDDIDTVMIAGGYVVSRFIDFTNHRTSFLFNIGAGAGALIVKRDWPHNRVLGTHLMSDGSMARHVIVPSSGTVKHPTDRAVRDGEFFFDLVEPEAMKSRLNAVSIDNWMHCVDEALRKSGAKPDGRPYTRDDIGFLDMLLVKPSAHRDMLERLGLTEEQSVYLGNIGHIGEQDTIISLIEGERQGRLHDGDLVAMVGAGIGYVWAAGIVQWGPAEG